MEKNNNIELQKSTLLRVNKHKLLILDDILNSDIISYNDYYIAVYARDNINFGYFINNYYLKANFYIINWYDYKKLKDVNYLSIELVDFNKLKYAILNDNILNPCFIKINYDDLILMYNKSKLI